MSTSISNGYDEGKSASKEKSKEDGSVTYKAEFSAAISASASESTNINNKYSFNLSIASVSVSAAIKDSSNIGASFSVSCGILPNTLTRFIAPPKLNALFKKISTKMCASFEYSDVIHHCGESLSLRTNKYGIDQSISSTQYGTQSITFAGGDRIDITASTAKSVAAISTMQNLQTAMMVMVGAQMATLALGAAAVDSSSKGSTGFRGNSASLVQSIGITGGALALSVLPMVAMMLAGSKAPKYESQNLKGPTGSESPNTRGILMDACDAAAGGKFTVKGQKILFQAGVNPGGSSLKFAGGEINMNGTNNCSFETKDGKKGVFLNNTAIKANSAEDTCMSVDGTSIVLKKGNNAVKLSATGVEAGGLKITPAGASVPGGTFCNGIVSFA